MDFHDYTTDLADKLWVQFVELMAQENRELWRRFPETAQRDIEQIVRRGGKVLQEKLAGRDPGPGWKELLKDLWKAAGPAPVQVQAVFLLAVKRRGEAIWELAFGDSWGVPLDK